MEEQLIKWLLDEKRGVITPDQRRQLAAWRSHSPDQEQLYQDYHKLLNASPDQPDDIPDTDRSWEAFEKKLLQTAPAPVRRPIRTLQYWAPRVAALLLVAVGMWYVLRPEAGPTEWAAAADPIEMGLSDGTGVVLRSQSRLLLVDAGNWDQERRVRLEGEAFFEVASDQNRPFLVEAGDLLIRVMGTSFNVTARPDDDFVEVLVSAGRVGVHLKGTTEPAVLGVGDVLTWNKGSGQTHTSRSTTANHKSWHTGVLTFTGAPLSEVCRDLSRHFQVDIHVAEDMAACRFTSRFDHTSLQEVFEILTHTFGLTVKSNPDGGYHLVGGDCG